MSADYKTGSGIQKEKFSNAILDLKELRRHPSQTFCILMGHTGTGKTSTFNHLLHTELPVSNKTSATRSVDVYSAETCGQGDLSFTIVDTPGMNDTGGIYQDACNMNAVQKFRKESVGVGVLPNIILLCVKATDNRIEGPESDFVRNIRTLESIKVIDDEKPNVVVVVTHACALPAGKYKEKKEKITQNYKNIMSDNLYFSAPVVFIENSFEDYQLKKDNHTGGTFLLDDEIQPNNLLNQITDLLGENGDDVAFKCMKKLLQLGSKISYSRKESNQIKIARYKHLDEDEKLCLKLLTGNTEAFRLAEKQFEQESKLFQEIIRKRKEEIIRKQKEENIRKRKEEIIRKQKEETIRKRKEEIIRKQKEETIRKRKEEIRREEEIIRKREEEINRKREEEEKLEKLREKQLQEMREKRRQEMREKELQQMREEKWQEMREKELQQMREEKWQEMREKQLQEMREEKWQEMREKQLQEMREEKWQEMREKRQQEMRMKKWQEMREEEELKAKLKSFAAVVGGGLVTSAAVGAVVVTGAAGGVATRVMLASVAGSALLKLLRG